ncbi:class I poly(R)-hydroxyalkanoic acid synthase [Aquabacterium sp. G14]|uniref:PHA/PHB synthase family protein n=2 Tax=Aquabacterium sp. G14 TaxID=3130164 RepID=UPI0030B0E54F
MAVPQKPRATRGTAKAKSVPQADTQNQKPTDTQATAEAAPHVSAFEQMGAAFRMPGVDLDALKAQWHDQLSKLPGFSPTLFQSWLQQSPMAGLNVPGLQPVQQAVEAVGHSVSDDLKSLAALKVEPDTLKSIQSEYIQRATELWNQALTKPEAMTVSDRRFAAPEWTQSPVSAFMASMYLLNAQTMQRLADSLNGAEKARERVRFAVQQWSAAMSPSNFLALNPEALKKAVETKGESIQQGIQHLMGDIRQGHLSMTDESVFEVGKNVATTPGTVVYENSFFQLIEYAPITDKVHAKPFLFVPPCINKYYILDLQPDNSVVRHLLSEGHRVFMVSWVNPDESLAKATWDDYIEHGVIQAIEVTREITGAEQINALGFCVGGTMLGVALATLAAKGRKPVASLTLLTSFLDFAHTGILDIFIDEAMVRMREMTMGPDSPQGGGLMKGGDLASTFAFLRPNDLVWNYVVGNYLKGEMPPAFDLLYWNSDSTNLPGPYYAWYLRNTYLENNLIKPGAVTVCGEPLDLRRLDMPTFIYGSREDHIVPWESAYASTQVVTGPRTFVLGASGHIAGVINPPAKKKRSHWVTGAKVKQLPTDANTWLASAEEKPGSWWTVWADWLRDHAGPMVAAPKQAGSRKYPAIEAAPGRYVLRKA